MKLIKLVVLFVSCLCCSSLFANERTDSEPLTKKSGMVNIPTSVNSVDTGITLENGDVWIWGFRGSGQAGNGKKAVGNDAFPQRVKFFVENGISITQLAAGIYHIIALDENGNVWGWGQNGYRHAVGRKTNGNVASPVLVLENKDVIMINAGEYTSYALTRNGEVYSWGHSPYGQAGRGTKAASVDVGRIPQNYFNNRPVVLIGAAYEGGYAINDAGEVFAWGDEERNAFGFENKERHIYVTIPKQITNLPVDGKQIAQITGGNAYTAFLTLSGDVYSMGAADHIGIGCTEDCGEIATPQFIVGDVTMLYCRLAGCLAVTKDQKLLTWGNIHSGFPEVYGASPTERKYNGNIVKLDGGKEHYFYWTDEGKCYGVGYGAANKFDQNSVKDVGWPGKELKFLEDSMREVYGENYIPGQGF
jgi:alpha-tubulin suppressor-like RCC1 family protein